MRVAASVAVTALVSTVLSGCMLFTPQQTARSYTPSDGVNGQAGDVRIRNVFLVTTDGSSATLLGALSNPTGEDATVTMQYATATDDETVTVSVPAGGSVVLRPPTGAESDPSGRLTTEQVQLEGIDTELGGLFQVGFASGTDEPVDLRLPVLTNSLIDYATLTPSPSPTPTRTRRTPSPSPSDTGAPVDSGDDEGVGSAGEDIQPSASPEAE